MAEFPKDDVNLSKDGIAATITWETTKRAWKWSKIVIVTGLTLLGVFHVKSSADNAAALQQQIVDLKAQADQQELRLSECESLFPHVERK